jgi:hypothetical protein
MLKKTSIVDLWNKRIQDQLASGEMSEEEADFIRKDLQLDEGENPKKKKKSTSEEKPKTKKAKKPAFINQGLHNTSDKLAVKCDLKQELRRLYDKAVSDEPDLYDEIDIDKALNCDTLVEDENEDLESLIQQLCFNEYIPSDVEMEFVNTMLFSTKVLDNGAEIILFSMYGEMCENELSISQIASAIYFDGEQLRLFTPYEGNGVNTKYKVVLGGERFVLEDDYEEADNETIEYCASQGLGNPLEESVEIQINKDKIMEEINTVLCGKSTNSTKDNKDSSDSNSDFATKVTSKNYGYMKYTYLHRKAFSYYLDKYKDSLSKEEYDELTKRAKYHDLDKQTLYLTWEKDDASAYHNKTARHHLVKRCMKEGKLDKLNHIDILESIFDFECAGLTKPDKPLNAYDTVLKYYSDCQGVYMPYLKKLNMDRSYRAFDEFDLSVISSVEVTPKLILAEVKMYLNDKDKNVYTKLGDKCMSEEMYTEIMK